MTSKRRVSIATYNVLADDYIRPEYYARCDPKDFHPMTRHPRLVARVAALDADVICLQEVDIGTFRRLDERLRPLGYAGRWAHKDRGKPDGCATFVRAPFTCLETRIVGFPDGKLADGPSGHVMIQTLVDWGDWAMTVINTHLKWDAPDAPPERRYGLTQAQAMLDGVFADVFPVVICGDFNATPDSDLLEAFRAKGFRDAHPPSLATFNAAGGPRKIDYLLHRGDLVGTPSSPAAPVEAGTALPSATEPSDHIPLIATFVPRT